MTELILISAAVGSALTLLFVAVGQLGRIAYAIESALEVEQADPDAVTRS